MRLKSLTIKGFKSFADETVVNFNESLIGIVGPNGSGKSNIVDSIRWVLGEQKTSELRLDSMSDVLFNGTKARKEGRVARVTLTFDNTKNVLPTDYNEVSISRVLYRNGNSEYRLNDVICRKKDIQSLFLDSGIGSNSYAIISLNMVEDILHDNGGSRRYMIEQAAGISKYKVRKKETLSKLRSTSEDLERVNDLLFEIQKNLSSFERQARRTERYNKLKEEYRELAINISKKEIIEISAALKKLREQHNKESDEKLSIETTLKDAEAKLEKLKLKILEAEKSLSKDQQEFNQLIEKLGQTENQKNLINQRIVNSQDRLRDNKDMVERLAHNETNSLEQQKIASAKKVEYQGQLDAQKTSITEVQSELSRMQTILQELRDQEKKIKDHAAATQQRRSAAERAIEALRTRSSMLSTDITRLQERKKQMAEQSESKRVEQKELSANLAELEEKLEKCNAQIVTLEERDQEYFDNINAAKSEKGKTELEVSSLQQRIKFLENIIEKNEGVSEAVKHILKSRDDVTLFSDVVVVQQQDYTPIVELFFEPYLNHVVVDRESDAMAIYDQVRSAQKGKIKAFALDNLPSAEGTQSRDGLTPLADVLKYDQKYAGLIGSLGERVYIYDGLVADMDWSLVQSGDTILCAQEYLIYTVGEIYGGSNTLFEGVQLGRKQILQGLLDSKAKVAEKISAQQVTIDDLQKKKSINQSAHNHEKHNRKELNVALDRLRQKLYTINSQVSNHDDNMAQIDQQIEQKSSQITESETELKVKSEHLDEINAIKIDSLSDDELSKQISDTFLKINEKNSLKDREQQKLYQMQSQYQMAEKDYEFHTNTLKSIETRRSGMASETERLQKNITEGEQELFKIKNQLSELYQEREKLQAKLNSYEDTYYKEKGIIFEREKEISQLRSKIQQKESLLNMVSEKISSRTFDLQATHDRNEIEFGFRIKEVELADEYAQANINELKLSKDKLNDKIRSFGDINPMAIDAYNEIKERFEHISKEQNDILEAKQSLEETIQEIETAASIQFNESLEQIKVNFKQVFQGLFSEDDDCDIVLLDTDDPLEAKIEIVAKPKGKRPKSISQLSGGEKTLTAASFLFALYLLKPAPFCIFDEVDAPLDDVNVLKFNNIIRKFSEQSQFIVITHNKLTMAEVDILYGVFLKEQGVSGVSAVDFRDFDAAEMEAVS